MKPTHSRANRNRPVRRPDQVTRQLELFVGRQLASDVSLELDQRAFDLGALGVVLVMRGFGEDGVDPLALRHIFRTDGQGSQIAVGGHVVQRLVMQLVGVEEGLQAG